jgi:hypothetical protein
MLYPIVTIKGSLNRVKPRFLLFLTGCLEIDRSVSFYYAKSMLSLYLMPMYSLIILELLTQIDVFCWIIIVLSVLICQDMSFSDNQPPLSPFLKVPRPFHNKTFFYYVFFVYLKLLLVCLTCLNAFGSILNPFIFFFVFF